MNTLKITCCNKTHLCAAETAQALGLIVDKTPDQHLYTLAFDEDATRLHTHQTEKQHPIVVELHTGAALHRRKFGGGKGQMIAKAIGVTPSNKLRILDATAGLGGDAFVLACLGGQITLHERSPIAYALLQDGLKRGFNFAKHEGDEELADIFQRMNLRNINSQSIDILETDVIYLDPMFPLRKKSAAVNKSMRAFHDLIGNDDDGDGLLAHALNQNVCRVVVKRPRIAPFLNNEKPSYSLEGKSSRFDVYAIRKLPT